MIEILLVLQNFGQQGVLRDSREKDVLANVGLKTRRNTIHEVFHLLLLSFVLVYRHQVLPNVILDLLGDVQTMHSGVGVI